MNIRILISLLVLFTFSTCALITDEYQANQRKVIAFLLEDLPLPEDAQIVKSPTVLLGTGDSISGRIILTSNYSPAENLIFYGTETLSTGWTLISSKVGEEVTLVYTKSGRLYRSVECSDFHYVKEILFPMSIYVQDLKSKTDIHITIKEIELYPEFDMDIYVDQVANLIGIEIEFTYNPTFVSFDTAKVNSSIPSSSYNILIQENNTVAGTVLLTLTTPQDNGEGLTGSIGLVQVSFTSLKAGFFE